MAALLADLTYAHIDAPIFVAIHVPGAFSGSLVSGFERASGRPCEMVTTRIAPRPGAIYAPGPNRHLRLSRRGREVEVEAVAGVKSAYTPSVDHLFATAAATYGADLIAVVLSGIGMDGLHGAQSVVKAGGLVLAQSQATSAASHMPAAVLAAGLGTEAGSPSALAATIAKLFEDDRR
jgi:two-component system chemotaxis response regulator CheB